LSPHSPPPSASKSDAMASARPRTAPCLRLSEWNEVSVLVQDMLQSAASRITPKGQCAELIHRRPHTACVCAQPLTVLIDSRQGEETADSEVSDGGSYDDDLSDSQSPARPSTAVGHLVQKRPVSANRRPQTSPAPTFWVAESEVPVAMERRKMKQRSLHRDEELLLSGRMWKQPGSQVSCARAGQHEQDVHRAKVEEEAPMPVPASQLRSQSSKLIHKMNPSSTSRTTIPASMESKIPKQCIFSGPRPATATQSGGGEALVPRAAKILSHVSWANFLPSAQGMRGKHFPRSESEQKTCGVLTRRTKATVAAGLTATATGTTTATIAAAATSSSATAEVVEAAAATAVVASGSASASAPTGGAASSTAPSREAIAKATATAVAARPNTTSPNSQSHIWTNSTTTASVGASEEQSTDDAASSTNARRSGSPEESQNTETEKKAHEETQRRKGPKYRVKPGASRPAHARKAQTPAEFMVLEFRTEPRIVPASRSTLRAEDRGRALRFRPGSRQWAVDRQALVTG